MVQNFCEIAENSMIENFHDKNFVIARFFNDYHRAAASVRTIYLVALPTIARGSALGKHASVDVKRKETRQDLYSLSAFSTLSVWPFLRGCWRIRYKMKDVVWTKILADLVGIFCSFSESKRTESVHC